MTAYWLFSHTKINGTRKGRAAQTWEMPFSPKSPAAMSGLSRADRGAFPLRELCIACTNSSTYGRVPADGKSGLMDDDLKVSPCCGHAPGR